jgi:TPP-dependent pyruvate/acetoin dehydrogenase alpha subunit
MFRAMATVRQVELKIEDLHRSGRISGSFHSSIGQEASAVGVCAVLDPDDVVTSTHRGHGHAIAKGVPLRAIFAELFGRAAGASGGRGGSMHLHHRESGFLGESAIVGGAMAWASGAAWARRRLGKDSVAISFIGDGAFSQGVFHETLRLSILWASPVLFVCENNGFAHSMPLERTVGEAGAIADFARAEGLASTHVDGRDVFAVREATQELLGSVREGRPAFLECEVFRVKPHSLSDPDYRYRPKDAGSEWLREHDPLIRLREALPDGSELDQILATVDAEVQEAVAVVETQPAPDVSDAWKDVYASPELRGRA